MKRAVFLIMYDYVHIQLINMENEIITAKKFSITFNTSIQLKH